MEQVRDLNMEADDMQVVLSVISGVSKRIKEVAQTHKDYRERRIIPYTQFAGKILYKVSDLERLLEENSKKIVGFVNLCRLKDFFH